MATNIFSDVRLIVFCRNDGCSYVPHCDVICMLYHSKARIRDTKQSIEVVQQIEVMITKILNVVK